MTELGLVRASVVVPLDPDAAFNLFTTEIDTWYRRGPTSEAGALHRRGIRFRDAPGVRLLEVYSKPSGERRTVGRVVVWEPGCRLVVVDGHGTEVEVTFAAEGGGTRVVLEHRGLEHLAPELATDGPEASFADLMLLRPR